MGWRELDLFFLFGFFGGGGDFLYEYICTWMGWDGMGCVKWGEGELGNQTMYEYSM